LTIFDAVFAKTDDHRRERAPSSLRSDERREVVAGGEKFVDGRVRGS
jgi:hypothetical protein